MEKLIRDFLFQCHQNNPPFWTSGAASCPRKWGHIKKETTWRWHVAQWGATPNRWCGGWSTPPWWMTNMNTMQAMSLRTDWCGAPFHGRISTPSSHVRLSTLCSQSPKWRPSFWICTVSIALLILKGVVLTFRCNNTVSVQSSVFVSNHKYLWKEQNIGIPERCYSGLFGCSEAAHCQDP